MKKYSLWVLGPAAIAVAIGALVPTAVSQAKDEWDIGAYDTCTKAIQDRVKSKQIDDKQASEELRFCCDMSGGVWSSDANGAHCAAPPATAQTAPKSPGEVVQAPSAGTADPGQNPERTGGGTFEAVPVGPGGGPVLYMP
ncbi:hypothetical protein [Mycolicibacterium celeriflavum]|uniref:hypothetical protein n=1 Tax=Mycolicibacterium celeriflavum TaxID=1249101 RepID=UPI003CF3DA61